MNGAPPTAPARANALPFAAVPVAFQGVWRRTVLGGAGIATDTSTQVFWLQTRHWHADVRIPAARPDFSGCRAPGDCSAAQQHWLAGQKGFAGFTEVTTVGSETFCQWHRQVDFQPVQRSRDFGRIVFSADGQAMEELGVDADYHETWVRLPQSIGPAGAWRRVGTGFGDLLLVAGGCFFLVRDRHVALPAAAALADLIDHRAADAGDCADAGALLDMEISYGRWDAMAGTGLVTHSTLPWKEGQIVTGGHGWAVAE